MGGVFNHLATALHLLAGCSWSSEALSTQGFPAAAAAVAAAAAAAATAAEAVPTAAGAAESLGEEHLLGPIPAALLNQKRCRRHCSLSVQPVGVGECPLQLTGTSNVCQASL